jgi:hypothetical protein
MWIIGRLAGSTAWAALSMSAVCVRASAQMMGPSTSVAMARTHSKSPWLVMGKPASITSTPRRASA